VFSTFHSCRDSWLIEGGNARSMDHRPQRTLLLGTSKTHHCTKVRMYCHVAAAFSTVSIKSRRHLRPGSIDSSPPPSLLHMDHPERASQSMAPKRKHMPDADPTRPKRRQEIPPIPALPSKVDGASSRNTSRNVSHLDNLADELLLKIFGHVSGTDADR
jgi:hypothetical protein